MWEVPNYLHYFFFINKRTSDFRPGLIFIGNDEVAEIQTYTIAPLINASNEVKQKRQTLEVHTHTDIQMCIHTVMQAISWAIECRTSLLIIPKPAFQKKKSKVKFHFNRQL